MAGRINHRGWIVLESINADDASLCVDFFEDPAGGFGFELLRSEPEDRGRWTAVGGFAGIRHETGLAAADAAYEAIPWLRTHASARRSYDRWKAALESA